MNKPAKPPVKKNRPQDLRLRALARWDNEGGATALPVPSAVQTPVQRLAQTAAPPGTAAASVGAAADEGARSGNEVESQHLHSRLIALENLVISLLALGNKQQLALAREMADHITTRAGTAPHRLTTQASTQMVHLVGRALWFRAQVRGKADED